jgi:hypothetical protein
MDKLLVLGLNMSEPTMASMLVKSCQTYNYNLDFYGQGISFRDYRQAKIDLLLEALKQRTEKYIMVTDGHDSWMLNNNIFPKFKAMKAPIVISGNRDHYPATELYTEFMYPEAPTSFKYICSSQMIGERLALINAFEIIQERYKGFTDQEAWNAARCFDWFDFVIDYKCQLFLNMTNVDTEELNEEFKLKETNSKPCSIHFGGAKSDSPNGIAMRSTFQNWLNSI